MTNQHIKEHRETLENALQLLKPCGAQEGICFYGKLTGLMVIPLGIGIKAEDYPQRLKRRACIFSHIHQDLANIGTLTNRLEWMKGIFLSDPTPYYRWLSYTSLDIEHLYVEFRSLCDHLARLIWCCFEEVPNTKAKSFYALFKWVRNNHETIDKHLVGVMRDSGLLKEKELSTWFGHMRAIRDDINHRGASSLVFATPSEGILFQILRDSYKWAIPILPHLSYNKNVVFFDKYFALQMANLLVFTERLSEAVVEKLNISYEGDGQASGFDTIHLWMSNFYKELKEDK